MSAATWPSNQERYATMAFLIIVGNIAFVAPCDLPLVGVLHASAVTGHGTSGGCHTGPRAGRQRRSPEPVRSCDNKQPAAHVT